MNILADATLPDLEYYFPKPFRLNFYRTHQEASRLIKSHQILLCRSTLTVTPEFLKDSPIECIATATSGIEHISESYLKSKKIQLYDAKGSNASAVADYVIALCALVFPNTEELKIRAGIIGLGEIGSRVAKRLKTLGCEIFSFDPPKAVLDSNFQSCKLEDLYTCELICIHANWHEHSPYPSHHLLSKDFFKQAKPGLCIINASRGNILHEIAFLESKIPIKYCTDVYSNEPHINPLIVEKALFCTPHIAGHSIEAKNSAIYHLSQKLHHHYHFDFNHKLIKKPEFIGQIKNTKSWQEMILSLYNPQIETELLKESVNKNQAFLDCRKKHQNRHDFHCYDSENLPVNLRNILGIYPNRES